MLVLLATPGDAPGQESEGSLLVRNVTLLDGTDRSARPGVDVLVRDGRIESIRPTEPDADFDGRIVEGEGRWLIPGLIDAHTHLGGGRPRESAERGLEWLVEGGVTSVRDMAGDARELAGFVASWARGQITAPRIHYSALMAGPEFMDDPRLDAATVGYERGVSPYMVPITDGTDIVQAVAMARGTGAHGIKLYAALHIEQVRAVTMEAHRQGLQVWGHSAIFPAWPVQVLDAGVDGVSHPPYVIWEAAEPHADFTRRSTGDFGGTPVDGPEMGRVIEAMVRNGTVLDPTLTVFDRIQSIDSVGADRLRWGAEFTRRAHEAGVLIAAGTDAPPDPVAGAMPAVHRELELLVELAGFTPHEALGAGTLMGARALGLEDELGTVEVGKLADLVLLAGDPSVDITNTREIVRVIQGGRVVR